jgi:hypothetical protein
MRFYPRIRFDPIIRSIALAVLILLVPGARMAAADEFSVLAGTLLDTDTHESTYAWQLDFRRWMSDDFAVSLSYLNEGHVIDHHRDGVAIQAWTRMEVLDPRLSLSGGIGPYYYFDTTVPLSGGGYANKHGWGVISSLALSWYTKSGMVYQVRANVVRTEPMNTQSLLLGVGYQWDVRPLLTGPARPPVPDKVAKKNELTVFAGRTIVNSFKSEHSLASGIEYRRLLGRFFEGTIAVLEEGSNKRLERNGAVAQLWLASVIYDRVSIGLGGGGYYARDRDHLSDEGRKYFMSGIFSLTASRRIADDWKVRGTWNRVLTNYQRDTDVLLVGLGYLF